MRRYAFTMIELIFVIVVMGIIGKFGVEFLAQAYKSFIFANVNHTLQSSSATAVEFIASRLQYRIKDSVIVRTNAELTTTPPGFTALSSAVTGTDYTVLEWVASDIDGFRGHSTPYWSGIIDLDASSNSILESPATDTGLVNSLIDKLSYTDSSISDAALYFIGSHNDINGYGWNGIGLTEQNTSVMHPIKAGATITQFAPGTVNGITDNFSQVTVLEYYKLAWTANAIAIENYSSTKKMGDLVFYYDYQPWKGEFFANNAKRVVLMENVSTFRAIAIGDIIKIQVCTKSDLVEEYSICKEKTIF
jgi:prepilin-type N-terminal cleavage/methylation domain-containing protein